MNSEEQNAKLIRLRNFVFDLEKPQTEKGMLNIIASLKEFQEKENCTDLEVCLMYHNAMTGTRK